MNKKEKELLERSEKEAKRLLEKLEKTDPTSDDYKKIAEAYAKSLESISKVQSNTEKKKVDVSKILDNTKTVIGCGCLIAGLYFEFTGGYFKSDILKTGLKSIKFIK